MVPDWGLNLQSLCWMHRVITSGPPGKSLGYLLLYRRSECRACEPMFSSDGGRQRQGSESFTSIKCTQLTPSNGRVPGTASPSGSVFRRQRRAETPLPQGPDPASQALCILFSWKMKLSVPFPLSLQDSISSFFLGSSYTVHVRSPLSSSVILIFILLNIFLRNAESNYKVGEGMSIRSKGQMERNIRKANA